MIRSTHSRRLATLVVIAGALAAVVPVAQAGSGFNGSPDAVDRAVTAHQAQIGSKFNGSPDAIDRVVAARQAQIASNFNGSPDAIDRALRSDELAAAGAIESTAASTTSGFDWSDFGIGAGAGIGVMLLLGGLGLGVVTRRNGRQVSTA
jgi:hypothetical protein